MSVKTKGISLLATLAVAAAGFYLVGNLPKSKPDIRGGEHTATVTSIWLPSPRNIDGVHIEVTVGGSLKVDKVYRVAPFHEAYPIKSGQKVEIRARLVGTAPASTLGCAASIDNLPVHNEAKQGPKTGDQVICWAIAP